MGGAVDRLPVSVGRHVATARFALHRLALRYFDVISASTAWRAADVALAFQGFQCPNADAVNLSQINFPLRASRPDGHHRLPLSRRHRAPHHRFVSRLRVVFPTPNTCISP